MGALLGSARAVHGTWGSGRLLRTSLVSVLITDSGHVLVGAVTPSVLYAAVAHTPEVSTDQAGTGQAGTGQAGTGPRQAPGCAPGRGLRGGRGHPAASRPRQRRAGGSRRPRPSSPPG